VRIVTVEGLLGQPALLQGPNAAEVSFLSDGAASDNKSLPIHRWVPWIAGFSGQFVQSVIDAYLPLRGRDKALVLDPFAGVGTTLIEALKSGCSTTGYEINPFAALAAKVKSDCIDIGVAQLREISGNCCASLQRFEEQVDAKWREGGDEAVVETVQELAHLRPRNFRSRIPFLSAPVEAKFLFALREIHGLPEPYRNLFLVALGAVMISVSNYTYEPSLSSRPGAGKPLVPNASLRAALTGKLEQVCADIEWAKSNYQSDWAGRERQVYLDSYFRSSLQESSVSLVVTSPPYMNNYHYLRNTRPQLHWLGLAGDGEALRRLEEENVGKFWQTVRTSAPIPLVVDLPELGMKIDSLREINVERGPYGGPGWANYVAAYFNDVDRFTNVLARQLEPGAPAIIVVGNSIIQGVEFKVDHLIGAIGERKGLRVEDTKLIRTKRVGNSILNSSVRNGEPTRKSIQLYDAAVVLRRPV
jgi:hypothetical protein